MPVKSRQMRFRKPRVSGGLVPPLTGAPTTEVRREHGSTVRARCLLEHDRPRLKTLSAPGATYTSGVSRYLQQGPSQSLTDEFSLQRFDCRVPVPGFEGGSL